MTNKKIAPKTELSPVTVAHPIIDAKPVSDEAFHARLATDAAFSSGMVVNSYLGLAADSSVMFTTLQEQAQAVNLGDMTQIESMLIGQAVALQTMFADLAFRAKKAQSLQAVQCLTQLALRSQAGSRSTLQTLADVKNPRQVAFVKQTNVANTQQVNNGVLPNSRGEKIQTSPNELLVEESHGCTTVDIRAKEEAGRADPAVVTMAEVDRPSKRRR